MSEIPTGVVVVLEDAGPRKIEVIREVRRLTGFGLKAAKTAVDRAPSCIKAAASSYEADQAVDQLRNAGARAVAVSPDAPQARNATPLSVMQDISQPALTPTGTTFYRVGFWILLLVVLYLWLRSA